MPHPLPSRRSLVLRGAEVPVRVEACFTRSASSYARSGMRRGKTALAQDPAGETQAI
jgi:hypothetical protein